MRSMLGTLGTFVKVCFEEPGMERLTVRAV
jgi:hypothetical protein